jgi:hypothetical protein
MISYGSHCEKKKQSVEVTNDHRDGPIPAVATEFSLSLSPSVLPVDRTDGGDGSELAWGDVWWASAQKQQGERERKRDRSSVAITVHGNTWYWLLGATDESQP